MSYYAGLDVGLRTTFICVVDGDGRQLHASEVASDAEVISRTLSALEVNYHRAGLETGQLSIHLSKALRVRGWPVVCMDARQVAAALYTTINKTDKNDARGIAHLLRLQASILRLSTKYSPRHRPNRPCDSRAIQGWIPLEFCEGQNSGNDGKYAHVNRKCSIQRTL